MNLQNDEIIAFDIETSGKYPIESEIIEIAAVRSLRGETIDTFQSFIRPTRELKADNIAIHGITNEMVASAPSLREVLPRFLDYIGDKTLVAHHAPFDLGFVAAAIEELGLSHKTNLVFCSSLMSRKILVESPNHRLQTLIKYLGLEQGAAHRALDDAKACLGVLLYCFKRLKTDDFSEAFKHQDGPLEWGRFHFSKMEKLEVFSEISKAIRQGYALDLVYRGGSKPGKAREVQPIGVVRSLDGDYLVAEDAEKGRSQRYLFEMIESVTPKI